MKNRLFLVLAIYSVAGLLALNVHAAPEDDVVGPPTAEEQQEPVAPEPKPAPRPQAPAKPAPRPAPRQQPPPAEQVPAPNDGPNFPRGARVEWLKVVCPQVRVSIFDFGDSWSKCYVEGTRQRYEVKLDSTGIEIAAGGFALEIKHTPGSDLSGYYTGDGASIGLPLPVPVGGAGGKFYQVPQRRGDKPLNRATLVGAQFGLGFSVIDGIRIRPYR